MNNFEANSFSQLRLPKNPDFFNLPNLNKSCTAKANTIFLAITNQEKPNYDTIRVNNKLLKATEEVLKQNHLEDSPLNRQMISAKILKAALEKIAENLGGNLRSDQDLENKYFDLLLEETALNNIDGHTEAIKLAKSLNNKNILDNEKRGELVKKILEKV